jgi:hypothetical protein
MGLGTPVNRSVTLRDVAALGTLPGDISGWFETFGEGFLLAVPPEERAALVDELREALRPALQDETGLWTADYVRLRFVARKQSHDGS